MLEKVKKKLKDAKEENDRRREERARIERERAEAEARRKRERAEEEARKESQRIQAEKDALMALTEKELMVEAIMTLRAYGPRLNNISDQQDDLKDKLCSLELSVNSLYFNISTIGTSVDELKYK